MSNSAPPPAPDVALVPQYVDSSVLECLYSIDKKFRAVITRDKQDLIHVRCEVWDVFDWESSGTCLWRPVGKGAALTDTVESARVLARGRLVELGAGLDEEAKLPATVPVSVS